MTRTRRILRVLRVEAACALAEAQHALVILGYRIRPYDMHLDARRWCWTRCGRRRSHDWWASLPPEVRDAITAEAIAARDRTRARRDRAP